MKYLGIAAAIVAFLAFATAQMAAGFAGIEYGVGHLWALVAVGAALLLRFTLPISIGAVFGAMHLWHWHWSVAVLFAAPGLVFVLPGVIPAIFSLAAGGRASLTRATPLCAEH